jgi:hypothetical protein
MVNCSVVDGSRQLLFHQLTDTTPKHLTGPIPAACRARRATKIVTRRRRLVKIGETRRESLHGTFTINRGSRADEPKLISE